MVLKPPTVTLLSYPEVTFGNLASYRAAALESGYVLDEVEPHRLSILVKGSEAVVLLDGSHWTPSAVIHRTVANAWPVVKPALKLLPRTCVVLNDPEASWVSRDKLLTALALSAAGVATVETLGVTPGQPVRLPWGVSWEVTKPACGTCGTGVLSHDSLESLESAIVNHAGPQGSHLVVQPRLGVPGRDFRAYVVAGTCLALMERKAPVGEFRTNLAVGGEGTPLPATHPAAALATRAVLALGLDHAGVDMLETEEGFVVLEVDAWAGFTGLEQVTVVNVAKAILDLAVSRCQE